MSKHFLESMLLLILITFSVSSSGQVGCTDPLAINYDPLATFNDGSCEYSTTDYVLEDLGDLPSSVRECSGLGWKDGRLWAQNDGGNTPLLFALDTLSGAVERRIRLAPGNWDWEDLATSADHLYIGDFGNNDGSRQNLRIYQITTDQLLQDTIWEVDTITFSFQDQLDYSSMDLATPYDCEAFFFHQDSLHLFTKDWVGNQTKHYVIPAQTGHYDVAPQDSFEVGGLVTGADIAPDGVVALVGYGGAGSFLWLLFDYEEGRFFSGNKRRINIGTFGDLGQTEGIAFSRAGEGFIASEELFTFPAQLFQFSSWQWTDPISTSTSFPTMEWSVAPNPFTDFLEVRNGENETLNLVLYDGFGKQMISQKVFAGETLHWNLSDLSPGFYVLRGESNGNVFSQKIIKSSALGE